MAKSQRQGHLKTVIQIWPSDNARNLHAWTRGGMHTWRKFWHEESSPHVVSNAQNTLSRMREEERRW